MKKSLTLPCLLALLSFCVPALHAQFRNFTPEELKMTEDPKAPGAAAVYLNLEEVADDPLHMKSYYARIKILADKGMELATVEVPYVKGLNKVAAIKARTIHPDGTISELKGTPEDLLTAKITDKNKNQIQFGRVVINLPNVTVGSILEYFYELRSDDSYYSTPDWKVQRDYFIHKARFSFKPFESFQPTPGRGSSFYLQDENENTITSLIWWPVLPAGYAVKPEGSSRYVLNIEDVPAIPNEDRMPPLDTFLYRVHFYYKAAYSAQEFWQAAAKRWSKEIEHFADQSNAVKAAVSQTVAATDSETIKARKLYAYVQSFDNTDFTRNKSDSERKQLKIKATKRAEDVISQKSGSGDEIAMTYLALLRAAGIKAKAIKVADRRAHIFDPSYMYAQQLDDVLVYATVDGQERTFDPGEKMAPFGVTTWYHAGTSGFTQSDDKKFGTTTPSLPYVNNRVFSYADVTFEPNGQTTANLRFILSGQDALYWRQKSLRLDEKELRTAFESWMSPSIPDGMQASLDHFIGLDTPDTNLIVVAKATGVLGSATAKRIVLPGYFFSSRGNLPFVKQEKRVIPVDMQYGEYDTDEVTYHLPAGTSIEGALLDRKEEWKGHSVYLTKTVVKGDTIVIKRELAHAFSLVKPEEYSELRSFYQKVADGDQQQLVLTRNAATASGN